MGSGPVTKTVGIVRVSRLRATVAGVPFVAMMSGCRPTNSCAPSFLAPYAVEEWERTAPELHRLHMLTIVDVMPLAAYFQAYARWRVAEEALAVQAERLTRTARRSPSRTRTARRA